MSVVFLGGFASGPSTTNVEELPFYLRGLPDPFVLAIVSFLRDFHIMIIDMQLNRYCDLFNKVFRLLNPCNRMLKNCSILF